MMITTRRKSEEDASAVAARAAQEASTKVVGNMRWHEGPCESGLPYREIATADGQGVRVLEPCEETYYAEFDEEMDC